MKPGIWDFTIYQGSSFNWSMVVSDSNEVAVNLTGYSGRLSCKELIDDTSVLFSWTNGSEITITPETGVIAIDLTPAATKAMVFDSGTYDLELYTSSDVKVHKVLKGVITLEKENTI